MLRGEKINLRRMEERDFPTVVELNNEIKDIGPFYPKVPISLGELRDRYNKGELWGEAKGSLLITDHSDRIVGEIGFFKGVPYMPGYEVGYRIYKNEDMGKGYTSEALRLFTAYLFCERPIARLEIRVIHGNVGSKVVAERCGFKHEGVFRKAVFSGGKYHDMDVLSLIRDDFPEFIEL